jgi:hypothetical protein
MPQDSIELSLVPLDAPIARHAGAGRVAGPGWFDSSWELRCGLEVCERWTGERPGGAAQRAGEELGWLAGVSLSAT